MVAIIAVPTFITGFYGMNVPYPGFSNHVGLIVAVAIMLVSGVALYGVFRQRLAIVPGRVHASCCYLSPAMIVCH